MILKVINNLIVDICVGVIVAAIKAMARIEYGVRQRLTSVQPRNVFPAYDYGHWERTVHWLEDILGHKFSYFESQVRFVTLLIGLFYGLSAGLLLVISNTLLSLGASPIGIVLVSIAVGVIFGIVGGRSLTSRPSIFDTDREKFRGNNFDR